MPTAIDKYIYNYEKRQQMRQHPLFIQITKEINELNYLTEEKIGCIPYILREALEKAKKSNGTNTMSILEWETYYLESGKRRNELIQKNRGRVTYQNNQYYGRTLDDILEIAKKIYEEFKTKYNFNSQAALNIVYINVIDKSYDEFKRIENTMNTLKRYNPTFTFELSDPLTNKEQAVDLFVYDNNTNDMVGAIQILPEDYYGFEIDGSHEDQVEIFKQQHEIFEMTYDVMPEYVYATITGQIKGNIPRY